VRNGELTFDSEQAGVRPMLQSIRSSKKDEKAEAGSSGSRNNDVSSVGTSFQLVRPDCQLVVSRSGKESKVGFNGMYVWMRVAAAAEV